MDNKLSLRSNSRRIRGTKNTNRKNTRRKNTRRKNTRRKNTRRKNTRRKNTRRKNIMRGGNSYKFSAKSPEACHTHCEQKSDCLSVNYDNGVCTVDLPDPEGKASKKKKTKKKKAKRTGPDQIEKKNYELWKIEYPGEPYPEIGTTWQSGEGHYHEVTHEPSEEQMTEQRELAARMLAANEEAAARAEEEAAQSANPLSEGWEETRNKHGHLHYLNTATGEIVFKRPGVEEEAAQSANPLPEGWEERYDEDNNPYYWHRISDVSVWERPNDDSSDKLLAEKMDKYRKKVDKYSAMLKNPNLSPGRQASYKTSLEDYTAKLEAMEGLRGRTEPVYHLRPEDFGENVTDEPELIDWKSGVLGGPRVPDIPARPNIPQSDLE
jgi:hypothetical protein